MARLVWLQDELLQSANDEIIKAERESWEPEPELIPNIKVYHYHNDHLGTPNELTNQDGEVVWLADYEAWGNTAKVVWREEQLGQLKVSAEELQPLRFQGQFIDQETGLHYNRFRYYDPDLGMFISRDPIGLMGGNNVFQYAPNPTGWVDPWGVSKNLKFCTTSNRWRDSTTGRYAPAPNMAERASIVAKRPARRRAGVEETTWNNAKNKEGRVFDENTGEELFWDRSRSRDGQWDMGHTGRTHEQHKQDFISGRTNYQEYLDAYNDPRNYRPESPSANRSRKYD